jgi:hypothetical protein
MTKSILRLKSKKTQVSKRLKQAGLSLQHAVRRENLRRACKLHTHGKVSKADILKKFRDVKLSILNLWLREGAWARRYSNTEPQKRLIIVARILM